MDNPTAEHSRRVDDLISQVKSITQEVSDFLRSRGTGSESKTRVEYMRALEEKQAQAMHALQQAMDGQQELLDQLASGEPMPQRRATDPQRTRPNMKTVEDIEIAEIKRLAGITG